MSKRIAERGISNDLLIGIDAYEANHHRISARGELDITMPNGTIVRGRLTGDTRACQPIIIASDGRRYVVPADQWEALVKS